jgi:hypothetical protein
VLDPILYDLLDPSVCWIPTTNQVRGKELQGFVYDRPFDQRYLNHLLEVLLSIVRFGGQGFAKAAKTTSFRRSSHTDLIKRIESGTTPILLPRISFLRSRRFPVGFTDPEVSYMDILVETVLR